MANLIVVSGPQAVGKMTVAESIQDKIKYNLMTNHDSIEVSDKIFGFGTPSQKEFNKIFREEAFKIAVKHNVDLIFTFVCAYDIPEDIEYLKNLENQFTSAGGNFYFVELSSDIDTRLERNVTPNRLAKKFSKKDIEWSRNNLLKDSEKYRLNSMPDEYICANHLKIDNSHLSPDEVANMVIETFNLVANEKLDKEYKYGR